MADQKQAQNYESTQTEGKSVDRGLFNYQGARKHECHHYLRMYGGQVLNAAMWGFGATLGADAANEVVGEAKEWWRH